MRRILVLILLSFTLHYVADFHVFTSLAPPDGAGLRFCGCFCLEITRAVTLEPLRSREMV